MEGFAGEVAGIVDPEPAGRHFSALSMRRSASPAGGERVQGLIVVLT
jgi:hypothetical protein